MKLNFFYIFLLSIFIFSQSIKTTFAESEYDPVTCEERLKNMEPSEPRTIYDYELMPDRDLKSFKGDMLPISYVQKHGVNIPFVTVYKNLDWQRPVYTPAWNSAYFRWSNVPYNIALQQHRAFDYEGGASIWYDLSNNLALPAETEKPSPFNEAAFTIKYPYVIRLIIFNFNISSIKYFKDQMVVSGEPFRKGLIEVDFDTKNLQNSKKLLQLATPDGYELDYLILNNWMLNK